MILIVEVSAMLTHPNTIVSVKTQPNIIVSINKSTPYLLGYSQNLIRDVYRFYAEQLTGDDCNRLGIVQKDKQSTAGDCQSTDAYLESSVVD